MDFVPTFRGRVLADVPPLEPRESDFAWAFSLRTSKTARFNWRSAGLKLSPATS